MPTNFYCTRQDIKLRGPKIEGSEYDFIVDQQIDATSRKIEKECGGRIFIPKTQTRLFRWPPELRADRSTILWLDFDLLSVSAILAQAQDLTPVAVSSYFLEPVNQPPYNRIEIDLSSSSYFGSGATPQRSISVAGSWGYTNATKSGGTCVSGLSSSASAVSMVCSNGFLIEVGNMLLIESEQVFVSDKTGAILGSIQLSSGATTQDMADNVVTTNSAHGVNAREVIRFDSEEMFVIAVPSTTTLSVIRAWNKTTLATHSAATALHVFRTLTIVRAQNGTTAATHADTTAVSVYTPPSDIVSLCIADVLASMQQEIASWGKTIGPIDNGLEFTGRALRALWKETTDPYKRRKDEAI